jgi:hypothetical protein
MTTDLHESKESQNVLSCSSFRGMSMCALSKAPHLELKQLVYVEYSKLKRVRAPPFQIRPQVAYFSVACRKQISIQHQWSKYDRKNTPTVIQR